MQVDARASAKAGDVAGIGWYFRFEEDDMKISVHALARCRRMEAFARGESCGLVPHDEGKAFSLIYSDSAKAGDVAGIGWYFRFEEDDMKISVHALALWERVGRRKKAFARGKSCAMNLEMFADASPRLAG